MGFASFGLVPPILGAALQEAIDASVILNPLTRVKGNPARVAPSHEAGELTACSAGLLWGIRQAGALAFSWRARYRVTDGAALR
jgi:hypothetical protein